MRDCRLGSQEKMVTPECKGTTKMGLANCGLGTIINK